MNKVVAQSLPEAHPMSSSPFYFGAWNENESAGTYPNNIIFQEYVGDEEPGINSELVGDWQCTYDIKTRSRFVGLDELGIGMVNTGSDQDDTIRCGNGSNLGARVGIVTLALNTLNTYQIDLSWKVRLIEEADGYPTPRDYRLSIQYRISKTGEWKTLPTTFTYNTLGKSKGDVQDFYIQLPSECEGEEYVQVRWKYYQHQSNDGGSRPFLALDDIKVLGNPIDGDLQPFVFTSKNHILELNCVRGKESSIDSLIISGLHLKNQVEISTSGNFGVALNKNDEFKSSILLSNINGQLENTVIYLNKRCTNNSVENGRMRISTEGFEKDVQLRGEGYYEIVINELMSSNFKYFYSSSIADYSDWIELYNPTGINASLQNYYLSDDINNLKKYRVTTNIRVNQKNYRIFNATGISEYRNNQLNFSLSSSGETIFLVGKDGKTIIDSITYPDIKADYSYGRVYDGADEWVVFAKPTVNASNSGGVIALEESQPPVFSHEGGFYEENILLNLSTQHPDAKIYYTLDGSDPDPNNLGGLVFEYKQNYTRSYEMPYSGPSYFRPYRTYVFSNPIDFSVFRTKNFWISDINATYNMNPLISKKINHANVVRAVAVEPNKAPSEIITYTYFFNHNNSPKELPIISLVLNEEDLKGFYNGIGVPGYDYEDWRNRAKIGTNHLSPANYKRSGRTAEIPINFELYKNQKSLVNQMVGGRIHGNVSRTYPHKSLRIYSREAYGKSKISHPIFDHLPYDDFSRFILRNSGNDFYDTYFKDALISKLMSFTSIDYQEYQPFNIFINGEYWGLLNARERLDVNYFVRKYGLDEKKIDIVEKRIQVVEGSNEDYKELVIYTDQNDMTTDESYKFLVEKIDLDNYIDYFILKIYAAVTDWPINNNKYWKFKTPYNPKAPYGLDGRWRWVDYDNDSGFNLRLLDLDMISRTIESDSIVLFPNMIKNDKIKKQFITRYSDLLNSAFKPDRVLQMIDQFQKRIEHDYIKYHIDRWPVTDENSWRNSIENMKSFAENRPEKCVEHLKNVFQLSNLVNVELDVDDYNKGYIKINTIEVNKLLPGVDTNKVYPWSGQYFRNFPISFIPIPQDGFKFSYWEFPDSTSYIDTISFDLTKAIRVKAYFEVDENYKYYPEPAYINDCPFEFKEWARKQVVGAKPEHMEFYYTRFPDSKANGPIDGKLENIRYDHDSQTRINGLGSAGLSLVNTGGANDNYFETRLGAVAVAINTENIPGAYLSFTAGTVKAQSKKYSLRLQYRFSDKGEFVDFYDIEGKLVEYHGSSSNNEEQRFDKIELPQELIGKRYVQLVWRYYYNGEHLNTTTNARDELRIDDIIIRQKDIESAISTEMYKNTLIANSNSQSYQWYTCQNDSIVMLEGATKRELVISEPGYYSVAVDYGECKYISDCEYFFVKTHKDFLASINTSVYPNPNQGQFELIFDEEMSNVSVILMDVRGQKIDEKYFGNIKTIPYNIQNLPNGVYVLDISTNDGKKSSQKLLIQR